MHMYTWHTPITCAQLLHDWGPRRAGVGWSIDDDGAPVSATKVRSSSYVLHGLRHRSVGPPGAGGGGADETPCVVHHPSQPIMQPSLSPARSLPDRSMPAGRGGSDGEAARAATARPPTWPRTPLVPRILPPRPLPLLQPITSSRRRAAGAPRPTPLLSPTSLARPSP
ncbi:hypothetical protein GQ55_5G404200 [Panicum hallii var. hallii]|uniref:Uncharacterized protein n=1 Tax=Panicum hallii var. hallii TaxID=1504633 RepID=A0A2T7DNI5_9POAL|nr:hypothetical protein GQ55_5G404200 [Panicum hallii var. hallii]